MTTARIALSLVLFLIPSISQRAVAQQDDVELRARALYTGGEYQEALGLYTKLYARTHHPTYIRNIGRCYQKLGKPDEAISFFREYLNKAENLEPKSRAEVEGFIGEMEDLKRQRSASPAPRVVPDETPPAPAAAAGLPSLVAPAATESADDSNHVAATLKASPRPTEDQGSSPIYARWWFWTVLAAVAVGGVTTALVFSSESNSGTPQAMTSLGTMQARSQ